MDAQMDSATQVRELTAKLAEAEDALHAVRNGEIDAIVVHGDTGTKIYALRSAEQPYRNLVEDMLEGAAILTTDGDILFCNRRFAQLVQVALEDAIGGPMERFISPTDRPGFRSLLAAGAGKRRAKLITATGSRVEIYLAFTTSVSEGVERRNLIVTDISELIDAQNGRDLAEQQSQAKDEFMAMLAHELRNPLSAITTATGILQIPEAGAKAAERATSVIARQARHLTRLVDDLLDVGRAVTGKIALDRRPVDLAEIVKRSAAVFCEREPNRRIELSTQSAWVSGDPVRLEQIISNIVGNAVKYTPPGGHIQIELRADPGDATLLVRDTGCGIRADLLPHVFELFIQGEQSLDRTQGGLGIGLTLVRRLVALHGGTVSVASDGPGRGSVFTVRLPRLPAPSQRADNMSSSPSVHAAKRRVLIVEDNRDAREMFKLMLELDGHQVIEAEEGCSGLRLLTSEAPDIAFIDVGLPGLDGYEVARRFRHEGTSAGAPRNDVLLVALTGYGTGSAVERSHRAGFDHHLIKPVDPDALYELLSDRGLRNLRRGAGRAKANRSMSMREIDSIRQFPADDEDPGPRRRGDDEPRAFPGA